MHVLRSYGAQHNADGRIPSSLKTRDSAASIAALGLAFDVERRLSAVLIGAVTGAWRPVAVSRLPRQRVSKRPFSGKDLTRASA